MERLIGMLKSAPAMALSAIALVASFALSGHVAAPAGHCGAARWADPAWLTLLICGLPILRNAATSLFVHRKIRASLLVTMAMVACVSIGQIFAAGEVAFIMILGGKLEDFTIGRAQKGLRKLVALVPQTAHKALGTEFADVPVAEIAPGMDVMVKPGETIPVDGTVVDGFTSVDQSVMTGESLPVDKNVGDGVYSGTVNRFGTITVRATRAGEDGSLQKLVRLVREAETKKAPMQRIADRWASILVPVSMAVALLAFLGVWLVGGDVDAALERGITILVVFCPCSLVLATPTSIMAAIGQAANFGVVVKSGEALERMGSVDTVCFDKTGTLTAGRPDVVAKTDDETLALAAAVEAKSEHPLAKAICAAAKDVAACADFRMKPGGGVSGSVDGRLVVCGTAAWLKENGVSEPEIPGCNVEAMRMEGRAVVLVAVGGRARGFVALADTIRPEAKSAIDGLREMGVATCLMTGDSATTAATVGGMLGVDEVKAELLPEDKSNAIEAMQKSGRVCCMVGDGVNDAVALKTAAVGVAMGGTGSDIAVEAADIALVGDDVSRIGYLKRLSNACVKLIKINIAISMSINAVAIVLSVLGVLGPVSGALVHNVGSTLVVLNAALLYDRKFR